MVELCGHLGSVLRQFLTLSEVVSGNCLVFVRRLINQLTKYLRFFLVQVYDMTFELNEVEARQEEYPSTLSYLNLLNVLIEHESDALDKGGRCVQRLGCGLNL